MSDEKKKPGNFQKMKEALKKNKDERKGLTKELNQNLKVAAAATQAVGDALIKPFKKKNNYRTAKARDVRTKAHGRLPVNLQVKAIWNGVRWSGCLFARTVPPGDEYKGGDIVSEVEAEAATIPRTIKIFRHEADGLFRLMEELDVMFWEWFAKQATVEEKSRLTFAPDPPSPAPWENPLPPEGTATESH